MYKPKMFLLNEDDSNNPVILEETGYVTEEVLQEFLASYIDLLPGDQIDPENPRRWILVSREMGVPDSAKESGRWSLDHLFLDQDGIPTFVECKRSSDTRSRREVVAQMLDYAANGIVYWSMDRLRQAASETAQSKGKSLDEEIAGLTNDEDLGIEGFWEKVETNLLDHRVRLIFVTDTTPKELRRLVEFLNEEMTHVEVMAVEVKQFQEQDGKGQKILASRVVGLTESARSRKKASGAIKRQTNRTEFLEKIVSQTEKDFFTRILDLAEKKNFIIYWGTLGFSIRVNLPDKAVSFLYGNPYPRNNFQFYFDTWLRDDQEGIELRKRLLEFGVFKESGKYTLTATVTENKIPQFNDVYDFILDEIDRFRKSGLTGTS